MKTTIVKLLLLLSLSFNITHAAFIAMEDDHTACHHATTITENEEESPYAPRVVELIAYFGDRVAAKGIKTGEEHINQASTSSNQ